MNGSPPAPPMEWRVARRPLAYLPAVRAMERRADAVGRQQAPGLLWLIEHRPCVTAGTSATPEERKAAAEAGGTALATGRGGRLTWHGPGQRVLYCVRRLDGSERDLQRFVRTLEAWIIAAVAPFGVEARTSSLGAGVFAKVGGREAKLASLGVRVRRWTTFHGFSINVNCDLEDFGRIVPCGLADTPITRLADLAPGGADMAALDRALEAHCPWPFTAEISSVTRPVAVRGCPIEGARP